MLGDFTGSFLMTALYLIAFLGGILKYEQYIHYLQDDEKDSQKMLEGFEQVKESIVTYIKVKFFMRFPFLFLKKVLSLLDFYQT